MKVSQSKRIKIVIKNQIIMFYLLNQVKSIFKIKFYLKISISFYIYLIIKP